MAESDATLATNDAQLGATAIVLQAGQHETLVTTSLVLNVLSIVSCAALLIAHHYLRQLVPTILNRISLRLVVLAAGTTIAYSLVQIASNIPQGDSFLCSASVYLYFYFSLLTAFLITAITYNLQQIFLRRKKETLSLERKYYMVCFIAAFVIPLPGYTADRFGWSRGEQSCWMKDEGTTSALVWLFFSYHLWILTALTYNVVVVVWILQKLYRNRKFIQVDMSALTRAQDKLASVSLTGPVQVLAKKERKRKRFIEMTQMVARIVQYPIVLVIVQLPMVLSDLIGLLFKLTSPYWLLLMAYVTSAMQGILLSFVFWYDPTVLRALKDAKKQLAHMYLQREQRATTVDEWGLDLAKDTGKQQVQEKQETWGMWFIGRFLISQADKEELLKAEKEAMENELFTPVLQEPEAALIAEKVRTYELEIGALGAGEFDEDEEAQEEEYWENIALNL